MTLDRFSIQSSRDRAQDHLHDPRPVQALPALPVPRDRVDHVAHASAQLRQAVVQFPQRFGRPEFVADLEELDADLPRGGFEAVERLGRVHDDRFRVIARHPVRDDDDVERLDLFLVGQPGFQFGEVGFQDGAQSRAGRRVPERPHGVEDPVDVRGLLDVVVFGAVGLVEEVDVHAVGVVCGADGRDGFEGVRGFPPAASGHAAAVVDQKDGVERAQEGVGIVRRGGHQA